MNAAGTIIKSLIKPALVEGCVNRRLARPRRSAGRQAILATESRKDSPLSPSRRSKSFASNSRHYLAFCFDDRQPKSANRLRANNAKLLGISSRRLRLLARRTQGNTKVGGTMPL